MFISDAFFHLGKTLEKKSLPNSEIQNYFKSFLDNETLSLPSRYHTVLSCFFLMQLIMWERIVISFETPSLAHMVLSHDHDLTVLGTGDSPVLVEAMKLPTLNSKLRLEVRAVDEANAFNMEPLPNAFRLAIVSSARMALTAIESWSDKRHAPLKAAILIKAPYSDLATLISRLQCIEHRVAGWLDVPDQNGISYIITMIVIGESPDAI